MPILNYTISIKTEKTAAEIQIKLASAKAQAVLCKFDDQNIMLAIVEAEQAEIIEVFLPYAQGTSGRTVFESIKNADFKLITSGEENANSQT